MSEHVPVLVGVGRFTQKTKDVLAAQDPLQMMATASRRALQDTGLANTAELLEAIDTIATVNMQLEMRVWPSTKPENTGPPLFPNPARTLGNHIGAKVKPENELLSSGHSGHSPQMLVNEMSERIGRGEVKAALLSGCEALATFTRAMKTGFGLPGIEGITVVNATG